MNHNSPRAVGSTDYLDFQILSDVETLRRRVALQPPRQAISKLELRDSLAKRRNIPLGLVFRYNSNGADIGIGVSLSNISGKRKVMAAVGRSGIMEASGARAGSFWGARTHFLWDYAALSKLLVSLISNSSSSLDTPVITVPICDTL
jgi:hypothetical protein